MFVLSKSISNLELRMRNLCIKIGLLEDKWIKMPTMNSKAPKFILGSKNCKTWWIKHLIRLLGSCLLKKKSSRRGCFFRILTNSRKKRHTSKYFGYFLIIPTVFPGFSYVGDLLRCPKNLKKHKERWGTSNIMIAAVSVISATSWTFFINGKAKTANA